MEVPKMEYILIENETVTEHISTTQKMKNPWIKVQDGWPGYQGIPTTYLDEDYSPKSLEQLVAEGIVEDNRGFWYSKEKEIREIKELFKESPEGFVREKWNHPTDELKNGKWITNKNKKDEYEQNVIRDQRTSEFNLFDRYQLPLPWSELSKEQKIEYQAWRNAWKDAPQTREIPNRPEWFQE